MTSIAVLNLLCSCHYTNDNPIARPKKQLIQEGIECSSLTTARFKQERNLGDFSSQPDNSYIQTPEAYFDISIAAGVIVADFNGDGLSDIFLPRLEEDLLYLNTGHRQFQLASEWIPESPTQGQSVGGSAADYDGDGDMDLYLNTAFGPDRLYQNTGQSFQDVSIESGIAQDIGDSTGAVWFDYDLDGDLDVFVSGHKEDSYIEDTFPQATSNRLYKNTDGTFDIVPLVDEPIEPFTYAAAWIQPSDGQRPWLYKVNDFGYEIVPNRIYDNTIDGFHVITGTGLDKPMYGMGIAQGDINGDQIPDFLISDFEGVQLLVSERHDLWYESALALGLNIDLEINRFSWGVSLFDFDNDADLDVFAGWGPISNHGDGISWDDRLRQDNTFWLGGEQGFQNMSTEWELGGTTISRGSAVADLDKDGILDLILGNIDAPADILWGSCMNGDWVSIELSQATMNRYAVGAKISLETAHGPQTQWIVAGDSFASSSPPVAHFGLGMTEDDHISIEVTRPNGERSSHQVSINQHSTIVLD